MLPFDRTQLAAATLALLLLTSAIGQTASTPQQPAPPPAFTFATVQRLAQERAARPYHIRSTPLPRALATLNYDQYREISFRSSAALWHGQSMFEVQFFHRGFNFDRRVNINEVLPSGVRPVVYNPSMFQFGPDVPRIALPNDLGFAGLRVHFPLNTPGYKDEVIAFLGASYFRALGRNQGYGVSARGLAIDTASTAGEEFPYFTDFWLVRPEPNQRTMTIYALLDSPSVAGAYEFDIRPGTVTQVQVTAELYPRRAVDKLGIAPLTSMYLYGESSEGRPFDDWRPEVHDSDGLMMQTGTGEWLWRPLDNPGQLQVNRYMDQNPKGFGLIQRDRNFADYQDPDSQYERRPSYWIQPLGNWGKGGIELVEIPSDEEIHDNIDAYWVPSGRVVPRTPIRFSYLMSAYQSSDDRWPPGGKVIATRFGPVKNGATPVSGMRLVLIDFTGGDLDSLLPSQPVHADVSADGGTITRVTVQRLPENGVWRVALQVKPGSDQPVDLRCYLDLYGEALTETWTYQWTPSGT
ncbi:MAG TPA: glucan biosynthesis protein [Steroidobacteraceae bacterium]|nr:glucan biosynthesis protein [Steroidobacteraceae bacterium]